MPHASAEADGDARPFIALWPDLGVRDALSAWHETWPCDAQAKRLATGQLHLTLHFPGAVPR